MTNLLTKSLLEMYKNDFYVLELLEQCDLSTLENNFSRELYARMPREKCEEAQAILSSDLVKDYDQAVQSATFAVTREIADLLDLVMTQNESGSLN